MWPGWQRTNDCLRKRNFRPKTVVVTVGDHAAITWNIRDASDEVILPIQNESSATVKIEVTKVYPAEECDGPPATDLAISGLFVEGLFY